MVEGKDEKIDSRYLEERGLLDLNTREAKSRLAVQDLKLAKPAPIRERSKQPIPLEYRDELGP